MEFSLRKLEKEYFGNTDADGRIILEWVLKMWDTRILINYSCLNTVVNSRLTKF
jgi:hypothetical protein